MPVATSSRRPRALAIAGIALGLLSGCGAVEAPSGPHATDPACAPIVQNAPETMLGLARHETTSQGTVAWGTGASTVVLRCGVVPPPPTAQACTRLEDTRGRAVDWIVRESDGIVTLTTYGRSPAVDITVPRVVAPDQPSAAALELAGLVSALPASAHCVGPGDTP